MSRMRLAAGLCALILSAAACGGDLVSTGDPLSAAEAEALAAAIAEQGFDAGEFAAAPQQSPGSADESAARITITINETGSCEHSGSATVSGSATIDVNEQTGTGSLEFSYTLTPNNCSVDTDAGLFTLTGDPNLEVSGDLSVSENSFEGGASYKGQIAWEHEDGRSGACGVDLNADYNFSYNPDTGAVSGSASVKGKVCSASVDRSVTVTP